jgi:hypothetical protein
MQDFTHITQRHAIGLMIDKMLDKLDDTANKEKTIQNIVDLSERFLGNESNKDKYNAVKKALADPDNRWVKLIDEMLLTTDRNVAKTTLLNLGYESFLR